MSTLIHSTAEPTNAYTQTVFNWDSTHDVETPLVSLPVAVSSQTKPVGKPLGKPVGRTSSKTGNNPAAIENVRQHRVGCEHVGSALATVLSGYGISIDSLISEIERLKKMG